MTYIRFNKSRNGVPVHPVHEPIARRLAARPSNAPTGHSSRWLASLPDPSSFHHSYERLFGLSSFMCLHDGPVWEYVKYAATATLSERGREWPVVCTTPTGRTTYRTTCTVLGKIEIFDYFIWNRFDFN